MLNSSGKDSNQNGDSTGNNDKNPEQGTVGSTGQEGEPQGAIEGAGGQQDALQPSGGEQGAVGQQEQGGEQQGTKRARRRHRDRHGHGGGEQALERRSRRRNKNRRGRRGKRLSIPETIEEEDEQQAEQQDSQTSGGGQQVLATIEEDVEQEGEQQEGGRQGTEGAVQGHAEGPGGSTFHYIVLVLLLLTGNFCLREGTRQTRESNREAPRREANEVNPLLLCAVIIYLVVIILAFFLLRRGREVDNGRGDTRAPGGGGPGRLDDPSVDEAGQRQRDLS
ncbi:hypothetical protein NRI_0630 [Neorickettsia risticii str. Illinois]|uniref:Uncharacterized protein n=1 Tax=Neorickettsia risticii (strain Illinois) TaxID=434131 RepID=C6V5D9_NEORI|nr:hypothetical protein [Neorickettsia risticii]ACT69607.1 hypothetical protein NRI_0630 [Neorickettsia risticii str. Illinois]